MSLCVYVHDPPGDNPNYWISMTASAEVLRTTKKVKKLIEEANKELKKQKPKVGALAVCLQPSPCWLWCHEEHTAPGNAFPHRDSPSACMSTNLVEAPGMLLLF